MAGLRGNQATVGVAKQTAFGTASAAIRFRSFLTGGNAGTPDRVVERLAETDASRDAGSSYLSRSGSSGTAEFYVRDDILPLILSAALGPTITSSGTTNYTHTIDAQGTALPYMTFWRDISATLWERYTDCIVTNATFRAEAGQPLICSISFIGRAATRLTTQPDAAVTPSATLQPYIFHQATITLGGGASTDVSSFELSIENNGTHQQTNNIVPIDVYAGTREVNLSFDYLVRNLDEYNKFHYGAVGGTAQSTSLYTTQATLDFNSGANNEVKLDIPSLAYEEFPIEPNVAGDPIVVSARGAAQRGASPVIQTTVKNQTAGTVYAGN